MGVAVETEELALLGGPKTVVDDDLDLLAWPIVTDEDRQALLAVLDNPGSCSDWDITLELEREWGEFLGTRFNLGYPNGTMALQAAYFAVGIGRGDEVICPAMTYWATATPALMLGAVPVFADIEPDTLCLDPKDVERRLTDRTKAIAVTHVWGHPASMDPLLDIARRHELKVIEDCSHAQGSVYRGRRCGSLGDVSACSMMARKSLAAGEAGMLSTNQREVYERAVLYSHYERHASDLTIPELQALGGLPFGGVKGRLAQFCAAVGRVQLKHYPARCAEIRAAMDRFFALIADLPGLRPHRTAEPDSSMGGWFYPHALYDPEALGGLPIGRFIEAVRAEGAWISPTASFCLHQSPLFTTGDIFHDGRPTAQANAGREGRSEAPSLPVTEALSGRALRVPWFKHDRPEAIARHAAAYRKVAGQARRL